ncbi:MAG: hypothetical protein IJO64_05245, partial [Clostridia bacterium]|nr:hypothetical protein [Clostridia bacterium]
LAASLAGCQKQNESLVNNESVYDSAVKEYIDEKQLSIYSCSKYIEFIKTREKNNEKKLITLDNLDLYEHIFNILFMQLYVEYLRL